MKTRNILLVLTAALVLAALSLTALGQMRKGSTKFKVRIENISSAEGFTASNGTKWPFAISPGAYNIHRGSGNPFFKVGSSAGSTGLEALAEDGNPEMLTLRASHHAGAKISGTFNAPAGTNMPGPVTPGAAFEFELTAKPGDHLFITFMFGQSNDLFFGNEKAIHLFDKDGQALNGEVTSQFGLWDAGTEVNEEPGVGPNQAPRQKLANTGTSEKKKVGTVNDGFTYPATADVLRITITPAMDASM